MGALIGALAGAVGFLAEPWTGPRVAAVLAVAVLVVVTGALHQDGLADCADGLGARGDRSRRLAIMRDPSIGTFGALALLLWLALLVTVLAELDRGQAFRLFVIAAASGRWAALVHAKLTPPARPDGLGAGFNVGPLGLGIATVTTALIALGVAVELVDGLAALLATAGVALVVTVWSRTALGGRTGDTLGATVALAEVAVALTLLVLTP